MIESSVAIILLFFGICWIFWFVALVDAEFLSTDSVESAEHGNTDTGSTKTAVIDRYSNGCFYTLAKVNGVTLRFMIDTGATNVSLSQSDAARLGFDTRHLDYCVKVGTANGLINRL